MVITWEPPAGGEPLVLLLKRPKNEAGYLWQPVTGNLETGEDFAAGALREAEEETGLRFAGPPRFLGIQHEYEGRWGPAEERGFHLRADGDSPPTPRLDPKEHNEFAWLSAREANQRITFPQQQEAILRATFKPSPLELKRDGTWAQDGETITHERTIELLFRSLVRTRTVPGKPRAGFVVRIGADELPVEVEDTPYFVSQVDIDREKITLVGGLETNLDPATLAVGTGNVLYCTVNGERAKFLRAAYYEIAKRLEADAHGKHALRWGGRLHPIHSIT